MTTNAELESVYDSVYRDGSDGFYTCDTFDESLAILSRLGDIRGKFVCEIGCGEGRLAALMAMSGAKVLASDYSAEAIRIAESKYRLGGLSFQRCDWRTLQGIYDAVVMQGVLEHLDDWRSDLRTIMRERVASDGCLVTSSPCFVNPRGYIWQALRILLDVPMSMTDKHSINPWEVDEFCGEEGYILRWDTIHGSWASGVVLIKDFQRRLPNALRDAGLPTDRVADFLVWLENALAEDEPYRGATAVYRIDKP